MMSAFVNPLTGLSVRGNGSLNVSRRVATKVVAKSPVGNPGEDIFEFSRYVERLRDDVTQSELYQLEALHPPEMIEHEAEAFLKSRQEATTEKYLQTLKCETLRFLADDLIFRVKFELPEVREDEEVQRIQNGMTELAQELCKCDERMGEIKMEMRNQLWQYRQALEQYSPSDNIRNALEETRNGLLDMTFEDSKDMDGDGQGVQRSSMLRYVLDETVAMLELRSIWVLVRELEFAVLLMCKGRMNSNPAIKIAFSSLNEAAQKLRIRSGVVEGKTRLSAAVEVLGHRLFDEGGDYPLVLQRPMEALRTALLNAMEGDRHPRGRVLLGESMPLRPRLQDIPNFEKVNDVLLRGGQPSGGGIKWLSDYGVRASVDLRGSDRSNQWTEAESWGNIKLFNIAIEDFEAPTMDQVIQFAELSMDPDNQPLFVHCKAGVGRTGTIIACWRVSNGESVEDALYKEKLYSADGGGLRQEEFVRKFAKAWKYRFPKS